MTTIDAGADGHTNRAELPSSRKLLRSTALSIVAAAAFLCIYLLPAEYGIDPTGLGALTGSVEIAERSLPLDQVPHRSDETTITLKPGHAAEVKLRMKKGARAVFTWSVSGGTVDVNSHGEAGDAFVRYKLGKGLAADSGKLEAPFYGHHGWSFRNSNDKPITVAVKTNGNYMAAKVID